MSRGPFVIRGILVNGKGDGQTISPRRLAEILPLLRIGHDDDEVINLGEDDDSDATPDNTNQPQTNNDASSENQSENDEDNVSIELQSTLNSTSDAGNPSWVQSSSSRNNSEQSSSWYSPGHNGNLGSSSGSPGSSTGSQEEQIIIDDLNVTDDSDSLSNSTSPTSE
ncbi:unnamed protein product [Enterobius vermicularis]|uniref:Uncharacterized protein n=1 Tax=Enterobius vermicularis TaxID=51028 RepID=A0A0N4V6V4_ENTVE|nr:unnamed protein product [Enterobius vermicularis]